MKKPVPMECDEAQGFFNSCSQAGSSTGSGNGTDAKVAAVGETPAAPEAEAAEEAGVTGEEAAAGAETAGAAAPEKASEAAAEGEADAAAAPETPAAEALDKRSEQRQNHHDDQYHKQLDANGLYQMESFKMVSPGGGHIILDNDALENVMSKKEQSSDYEYERMGDSACVDFFACCAAPNDCRNFKTAGFMDVLYYAQSGDIILFDNKCNLGTCLISCFTRSDWDHVGIVIRKPGGKRSDVYILEALAPTVCMDPLAKVMEWVIEDDGEGVM
jgi:hypothetical protein